MWVWRKKIGALAVKLKKVKNVHIEFGEFGSIFHMQTIVVHEKKSLQKSWLFTFSACSLNKISRREYK